MDGVWQWAEEQWSACDLGDRRRTRRAVALGVRMAEHSNRCICSAGQPDRPECDPVERAEIPLDDRLGPAALGQP
jgi:hypothetical protein